MLSLANQNALNLSACCAFRPLRAVHSTLVARVILDIRKAAGATPHDAISLETWLRDQNIQFSAINLGQLDRSESEG
jgi:hypothetical protein